MNDNLIEYYNDRAKEYEKVYKKFERQEDLLKLKKTLQHLLAGKNVIEIACGTGYWTEIISEVTNSIDATDINQSVLDIAKNKIYKCTVNFDILDIFKLSINKEYDCLFGGFIWSHILIQDLDIFLTRSISQLKQSGTLVFIDNNYVENSNHPIIETDKFGNTYQKRNLENGESYLVLKNFPTRDFIVNKLSSFATEINFIDLKYYWILTCKIK